MTAPSPPSTTSDLEAARHLIRLGEVLAQGGPPVTSSRASRSAYRIPDSVRASQFSSDRHSPDDASLGWTGLMSASRGRQAKTSITDEDLGTTGLALGVITMATQTSPRNYPGSCDRREPKSPEDDDVRSANLRGVVCGALVLVLICLQKRSGRSRPVVSFGAGRHAADVQRCVNSWKVSCSSVSSNPS